MRSLKHACVVAVTGALIVVALVAATSIRTDGDVTADGVVTSGGGVVTPGNIYADGIVQSGAGGFKFPDGTVQMSAAAELTAVANTGRIFQVVGCSLANGESIDDCDSPVPVPAGKILVVEFVSVSVEVPQSQPPPIADLLVRLSDGSSFYEMATISLGYSGSYASADRYRWTSPTRAYLDEGENIGLRFYRQATTGNAFASAVAWGYYVDKL